MPASKTIWPALLRAGAFHALHGGHPGEPQVGVTVPVRTGPQLAAALNTALSPVTLLVAPTLARTAPELLAQATRAGHEVAGLGRVQEVTLLEAASGQPVTLWSQPDWNGHSLHEAHRLGLRPLPQATEIPEPGNIVQVEAGALAETLAQFRALGYRAGRVRDLPGLREGTPRDLFVHEYIRHMEEPYARQQGMIDLSAAAHAVMRVAPLDYAPAPLPLPPGTPTAELHVNSARLVGLTSRSVIGTYRTYQRNLRDVGKALQERPELAEAQAVFAVTLLYPVLEKAGFYILDLPPLTAKWYGLGFRLLRIAYGTTRTPSEATPKMGWLTREEFLAKYG